MIAAPLFAQDTTVVSTLTFDSITTRRGWWEFPPASEQFRKVLMIHTLKCDPQTTWDQYPCGEWDYLTYHFVHEHTGMNDSAALQHPYFKVGTAAPDSVWVSDYQHYMSKQWWRHTPTVQSVTSESMVSIGSNDTLDRNTFKNGGYFGRSQYLFTAEELGAAGLVAGPINRVKFNVVLGPGGWIPKLVLRMKHTTDTALTTFDDTGLETLLIGDNSGNSSMDLLLSSPFVWDGTSHLLCDIAVKEIGPLEGYQVQGMAVPAGVALNETGNDGYLELDDDFIGVDPAPLAQLSDAMTITFRSFGAPQLPLNTSLLEAVNANGQRVFNIHLPWSNGRVYWDAGTDGSAYDRIDRDATEAEYEGQWTDWAFVKNTATGSMKIYRNGLLWHSGSGKIKPIVGAVRFRIGADANGNNPWAGLLDELNLFSTEVSATDIAAWAGRKVTVDHPDHGSLLYRLAMDEHHSTSGPYVLVNAADADHGAWPMGTVRHDKLEPVDLAQAPVDTRVRPVITFVQGDHVIVQDSVLSIWPDSDTRPLLTREIFAVDGNTTASVDTLFGYADMWDMTMDPQGVPLDSVLLTGAMAYNDTLDYFGVPYEVVNDHEIGRYITPYGIGLSLGPDGFSWVYDVTDYQYLLHDSVELSAGNTQELIDLTFLMIDGDAPRPVVNTQRPWGPMRGYSYAGLTDDTQLPPVTVGLHPDASQWMLRSRLTGHGHNSNDGEYPHCCEWKDNTHYLTANGTAADEWHIWQENECANNPVYPQGGTWLGSREGWCPGDLVKDRDTELTSFVAGDSLTIDYAITPVPQNNLGMGGGNYMINMDLFEFGSPSHAFDAEIHDVRRPNDSGQRSRENPICNDPVIVLRNNGTDVITAVTFNYTVSGGQAVTYDWNGSLAPNQRTEVELPVYTPNFWAGDGENFFEVVIVGLNGGGPDGYAANDHYRTHFDMPVIYPDNFVLYYKTNNRPQENALYVRDINGDTVFSRTSFAPLTIYRDTLQLPPGCYELEFTDSANDGLRYWADPDAGIGFFRFRSLNNSTLLNFEPEFGHRIYTAFGIGTIVGLNETVADVAFNARPNPSDGAFTLSAEGISGPARLEVVDPTGRLVMSINLASMDARNIPLDLTNAADGIYLVRLVHEAGTSLLRLAKR